MSEEGCLLHQRRQEGFSKRAGPGLSFTVCPSQEKRDVQAAGRVQRLQCLQGAARHVVWLEHEVWGAEGALKLQAAGPSGTRCAGGEGCRTLSKLWGTFEVDCDITNGCYQ